MREKLSAIVDAEQADFLQEMKQKSVDEVIALAFSITVRTEIARVLKEGRYLSDENIAFLCTIPSPIQFVYDQWLHIDDGDQFEIELEDLVCGLRCGACQSRQKI